MRGVMSIATLTGFDSREKLCLANPDVMVRDLGELQRLLEIAPPTDEPLSKNVKRIESPATRIAVQNSGYLFDPRKV